MSEQEMLEDLDTVLMLPEDNMVDAVGELYEDIMKHGSIEIKTAFIGKVLHFLLHQSPEKLPLFVYLCSLSGVVIKGGADVDKFGPEFIEVMRRSIVFLHREWEIYKHEQSIEAGEDPGELKYCWDGHNSRFIDNIEIVLSMLKQLEAVAYEGLRRSPKAKKIAVEDEEYQRSVTDMKDLYPKLYKASMPA